MSEMEIMGGELGLGWLRSHERMEDYGPIVRTFIAEPIVDPPAILDHRKWLVTENQGGSDLARVMRERIVPRFAIGSPLTVKPSGCHGCGAI